MTLPSLRTARWWLDPWQRRDVDAVHALLTDPDMRHYLMDGETIPRERAAFYIERHLALAARIGMGTWALRQAADGPMLGFCGISEIEEGGDLELMYGLLASCWRQGLASEAARAVLERLWQATGVARVFARADPPNARSLAVMRRLGMRPHPATGSLICYVLDRPAALSPTAESGC